MSDNSDLVRMINQMADFYRPYPRDEAIAGISEHIVSFWEPRMRKALAALLSHGGEGLSDLALAGAKATQK
jgi:formate dehydrogenase subunit delta